MLSDVLLLVPASTNYYARQVEITHIFLAFSTDNEPYRTHAFSFLISSKLLFIFYLAILMDSYMPLNPLSAAGEQASIELTVLLRVWSLRAKEVSSERLGGI
jgi:hypothetical protein